VSAPRVSIVLPLSGGAAQARRCLEAIAAQAGEPTFEVVIVDDASVGLDSLLAQLDGDVQVLRTDRRLGFAAAAALGAERARGAIVVLVRAAAAPAPGWLAPLSVALNDRSVGLAASVTVGATPTSPVAAWSVAARAAELRETGIPEVAEQLAVGALALRVAERGLRVVSIAASAIAPPGARTAGCRQPPGEAAEVTIVIPTLDALSERARACIAAVQATTDVAHEIVIVDNGSPPQGFTRPVNAGVRAAQQTPYIVIMNDDVEPLAGWWPPLRAAIDAGADVVFPLTIDGGMRRDFAAWCFALARDGVERLAHAPGDFLDPSMVVWYQDTDLLHRLRELGRPPVLVETSQIRHALSQTIATEDPELGAWIRAQVVADREQFLRKHPDALLQVAA